MQSVTETKSRVSVTVDSRNGEVATSVEAEDNLTSIRAWVVDQVYGDNEELRALLICSALLEAHLWVIWDRSFEPKDNLAVYYAEEIPLLKGKSLEDLREIHKVKLAFPRCRVIQEGPDSAPAEGPQQADLNLKG